MNGRGLLSGLSHGWIACTRVASRASRSGGFSPKVVCWGAYRPEMDLLLSQGGSSSTPAFTSPASRARQSALDLWSAVPIPAARMRYKGSNAIRPQRPTHLSSAPVLHTPGPSSSVLTNLCAPVGAASSPRSSSPCAFAVQLSPVSSGGDRPSSVLSQRHWPQTPSICICPALHITISATSCSTP
jgi:hypothetical protein